MLDQVYALYFIILFAFYKRFFFLVGVYLFFIIFLFLEFFNSLVRKNAPVYSNSYVGYFLAGRGVHFWPQVLSLAGTQIGAGLIFGISWEFQQAGYWIFLYPIGIFLGFILLSRTLHFRFSVYDVSTNAEIFFKVYGCPYLKIAVSFVNIATLFIVFIAQVTGSKFVFQYLGMDSPSLFVGFWAVVILYSMQGGLKTIISTDKIQIFSIIFVFLSFFLASFFYFPKESFFTQWQGEFSFTSVRYLIAPILYLWIEQDMEQRCLAGSFKTVSKALTVAGFVVLSVSVVIIFLTSFLSVFEPCIVSGDVLLSAIERMFSKSSALVFACVTLFAITSTATSVVNAVGCILVADFSIPSLKRIEMIPIVQGMSCTIAFFGILFASVFDSILNLLLFAYGLSICSLLVPLLVALKRKKMDAKPAWYAFSFGFSSFLLGSYFFPKSPIELASLGFSCFGFFVGAKILGKKNVLVDSNSH